MPSTISAGTTAGTAIAIAGDTTGNLAFQTNGTTTAMTINTSQQVGIGTTTPTANTQLDVVSADSSQQFVDVLRLKTTNTGDVHPSILFESNRGGTANALKLCIDAGSTAGSGEFTLRLKDGAGTFNSRLNVSNDGLLRFNSGYGSLGVAYGCRAWVNFNGSNGAIRASGNVSSVSRDSTGQYTINFTTAMPNINYGVSMGGSITFSGGVFYGYGLNDYSSWSTSACKVRFVAGNGTYFDPELGCISVFR